MAGKQLFGWHDIDLKHGLITVRREIAKNGDQRTIRLQPVAVEWLKLAKELKNPLPPVNERRLVDAACERIGLEEWLRDGLERPVLPISGPFTGTITMWSRTWVTASVYS